MENVIFELINMLENIAPEIWGVLLKQVYIEATMKLVWAGIFGIIVFVIYKFLMKAKKNYEEEWGDGFYNDEGKWILYALASVFPIILGLFNFVDGIMWFMNPEFYAIRFLLEKIAQ